MPDSTKSQQPKLLDQVRQVLRLHHYSIHTERSYVDWIVRFVHFHSMRSREDLFPTEAEMESIFSTWQKIIKKAVGSMGSGLELLVSFILVHNLADRSIMRP